MNSFVRSVLSVAVIAAFLTPTHEAVAAKKPKPKPIGDKETVSFTDDQSGKSFFCVEIKPGKWKPAKAVGDGKYKQIKKKVTAAVKNLRKQVKKLTKKITKEQNKETPNTAKIAKLQAKLEKKQNKQAKKDPKYIGGLCKNAAENNSGGGEEGGEGAGTGDAQLTKFSGTVTTDHINTLCRAMMGCTPALRTTLLGLASQGIDAVVTELMKVPSDDTTVNADCEKWLDGDYESDVDDDDNPLDTTFNGIDYWHVCNNVNGGGAFLERFTKFVRAEMVTVDNGPFDEGTDWHRSGLIAYTKKIRNWVKAGLNGTGGTLQQLAELIALDPVMLVYLDGNLNRKPNDDGTGGANENYAREFMELEFLGTDYLCDPYGRTGALYNSIDVAELSKAFTGRRSTGIAGEATTLESPENRVTGAKTIFTLMKTGGVTVDTYDDIFNATFSADILPIVHRFWAGEIARYFVKSNALSDCSLVNAIANAITAANGNVMEAMRTLLTSVEFLQGGDAITMDAAEFMISATRNSGIPVAINDLTNSIISAGRMYTRAPTVFYYLEGIHLNAAGAIVSRINFVQDHLTHTTECRDLITDAMTVSQVISLFSGMMGWTPNADQVAQISAALDSDTDMEGVQFDPTTESDKDRACQIAGSGIFLAPESSHRGQ